MSIKRVTAPIAADGTGERHPCEDDSFLFARIEESEDSGKRGKAISLTSLTVAGAKSLLRSDTKVQALWIVSLGWRLHSPMFIEQINRITITLPTEKRPYEVVELECRSNRTYFVFDADPETSSARQISEQT